MRKVTVQNKVYTQRLKPFGYNQSVILLQYCFWSNMEFRYSATLIQILLQLLYKMYNDITHVTDSTALKCIYSFTKSKLQLKLPRSACAADD